MFFSINVSFLPHPATKMLKIITKASSDADDFINFFIPFLSFKQILSLFYHISKIK